MVSGIVRIQLLGAIQRIESEVEGSVDEVQGVFPLQRFCAFCFAKLSIVEELISVHHRMIVLFSGFHSKESLCVGSIDFETPTSHCIVRFQSTSWAVLMPEITPRVQDHVVDAIVIQEIENPSLMLLPVVFKKEIRLA